MTERTTSAEDRAQGRGDQDSHASQRPTQLPGGSWWAAVKRTVREFQVDNLSDWAAALTYYSVLSIFPALLVVISWSIWPAQGHPDAVGQPGSGRARLGQILATAIENLQQTRGSAGLLALVSLATALWLASRYIAACAPPTPSTTYPRAGRCGRPCPSGSGSPWWSWSCWRCRRSRWWPPAAWPSVSADCWGSAAPRSRSGTWPSGRCCC